MQLRLRGGIPSVGHRRHGFPHVSAPPRDRRLDARGQNEGSEIGTLALTTIRKLTNGDQEDDGHSSQIVFCKG